MSNPQRPQQRRSRKGGPTPQDIADLKARQTEAAERKVGHDHGTDKGDKGGGEGGGVPPDQQPDQA
ncbi:hypothetical protein [Streptomyces sp. NPDC101165]|uniref:hypothetical protein n=1 Tax=Streptomyces sp. NPDC101165 TaxID=3366119 RepID=UPI003800A7B7